VLVRFTTCFSTWEERERRRGSEPPSAIRGAKHKFPSEASERLYTPAS
jgi:hypothetical protein